MKDNYVIYLKANQEMQDFFMVKQLAVKYGSNKKKYLDLLLGDCTGEVSAKKWDIDDEEYKAIEKIKVGEMVKVKAAVTEWKGMKQLKVTKIRKAVETDKLEIKDFFKTAPEESEDMYNYIVGKIEDFEDDELKRLCLSLYTENKDRLMYYPAAKKNHHAEYGGLLYHVKRMIMMGDSACDVYTNLNRDLLLAGAAIHDMEKLNEILSDEHGISEGYSFEGQLLGHITQGVKLIDAKCKELDISYETTIMLEHMVLSHHYEPEFGSPKKPLFPEAEMLHYLDMVDAKMFDMEESLEGVEGGEFGDAVWTLGNRRLYKRKK